MSGAVDTPPEAVVVNFSAARERLRVPSSERTIIDLAEVRERLRSAQEKPIQIESPRNCEPAE